MLGVLRQMFTATPPLVHDPDRLVRISESMGASGGGTHAARDRLSFPEYAAIAQSGVFAGVGAVSGVGLTISSGPITLPINVAFATASFFEVVGVAPIRGRIFTAAEEAPPAGEPVIMLGEPIARRLFGSRDAVGRQVSLNGQPSTVIGVVPALFVGTEQTAADAWMPVAVGGGRLHGSAWDFDGSTYWLVAVGRLRSSSSLESTEIALNRAIFGNVAPNTRVAALNVTPLNPARGRNRPLDANIAVWLSGVALAVLVIACANVGSLLLTQVVERRLDIAIRIALGASRRRVITGIAVDVMLLCAAGGMAAAVLMTLAGSWSAARNPSLAQVATGSHQLTFTLAVAACGLVSLIPVTSIREAGLGQALRNTAPGGHRGNSRVRSALTAVQVSLTVVLLSAAGLFVASFAAISSIDLGFDPERIVVANLDPLGEMETSELEDKYRMVADRLTRDKNVEGVAVGTNAPFLSGNAVRVVVPGRDSLRTDPSGMLYITGVTTDFATLMGMRLVSGRWFGRDELEARVAVVTKTFADMTWPAETAVGKCLHFYSPNAPCVTVVGVAADLKRDKIGEQVTTQLFVPLHAVGGMAKGRVLFVRIRGDPAGMSATVTRVFREELPASPFPRVTPLTDVLSAQRRPWRLGSTLFSVFGAIAVFIAAVGLYNVLYHDVRSRRREVAIRLALGAPTVAVIKALVAETALVLAAGCAIGMTVATVLAIRFQYLLFRTSPVNPVMDLLICLVVAVAAIVAFIGPLRLAVSTPPTVILRQE